MQARLKKSLNFSIKLIISKPKFEKDKVDLKCGWMGELKKPDQILLFSVASCPVNIIQAQIAPSGIQLRIPV
jgi:hypothetical protein